MSEHGVGIWRGLGLRKLSGRARVGICHSWGPYGSVENIVIKQEQQIFQDRLYVMDLTATASIASQEPPHCYNSVV